MVQGMAETCHPLRENMRQIRGDLDGNGNRIE